jgi:hypothetical protein
MIRFHVVRFARMVYETYRCTKKHWLTQTEPCRALAPTLLKISAAP